MRTRSFFKWLLVVTCSFALAFSTPYGCNVRAQDAGAVTLRNVFQKVDQMQTNSFRFQAGAGPVTIAAPDVGAGHLLSVRVEDAATHVLVHEVLLGQEEEGVEPYTEEPLSTTTTFALDTAGSYNLLISNIYLGDTGSATVNVSISGTDLVVPDTLVPELSMRSFPMSEVITKPFDLAPTVSANVPSANLQIYLDEDLHSETALTTGTHSVIINPADFEDGFHVVGVSASRPDSANETVVFGSFFSAVTPSFLDVKQTHWAYGFIELLYDFDYITGFEGNYTPDKPSTRAEFATLLAKFYFSEEELAAAPATGPFTDMNKHWSAKMVNLLAASDLISGSVNQQGQRVFRPNDTINRAEAATMIGNMLGLSQEDITGQPTSLSDFAKVPSWAQSSVLMMNQFGFINGFKVEDTYLFRPFNNLTKAEGATILAKVIGF